MRTVEGEGTRVAADYPLVLQLWVLMGRRRRSSQLHGHGQGRGNRRATEDADIDTQSARRMRVFMTLTCYVR